MPDTPHMYIHVSKKNVGNNIYSVHHVVIEFPRPCMWVSSRTKNGIATKADSCS